MKYKVGDMFQLRRPKVIGTIEIIDPERKNVEDILEPYRIHWSDNITSWNSDDWIENNTKYLTKLDKYLLGLKK